MLPLSQISTRRMHGAALLLALLFLIMLGLTLLLGLFSTQSLALDRARKTESALAQAKEALLAYALTYPEQHSKSGFVSEVPGYLPCPDLGAVGKEGEEAASCGLSNEISLGMLPWKTLNLPPLRDGDGNCLWYAVSGSFKQNPAPDLLNWDSAGQFQILATASGVSSIVAGKTEEERPAAVIFAPGAALPGQPRAHLGGECGGDYDPAHFLDRIDGGIDNAAPQTAPDGSVRFTAAGPKEGFNDRLLWITPQEIFARGIEGRSDFGLELFASRPENIPTESSDTWPLAQNLAFCLAEFGKQKSVKSLPWASALPHASFKSADFGDSPNIRAGRFPLKLSNSGTSAARTDFNLCVTRSFFSGISTKSGWWDKWKDHFFYASAELPDSAEDTGCGSGQCLSLDENGPYVALVIFANRRLAGQTRQSFADRNNPANYLESENAAAISITSPADPGFGRFTRRGSNELFVCVLPDLSVDLSCGLPAPGCPGQSRRLLEQMVAGSNQCRSADKTLDPFCAVLAAQMRAAACPCADAADILLKPPCLTGISSDRCRTATAQLLSCTS
ncbi:MAG: hypothetical protein FWD77_08565 [Betaproteobacteria bacterium]|nr:hypothetical protein [Betaproteobacteria bacterium]